MVPTFTMLRYTKLCCLHILGYNFQINHSTKSAIRAYWNTTLLSPCLYKITAGCNYFYTQSHKPLIRRQRLTCSHLLSFVNLCWLSPFQINNQALPGIGGKLHQFVDGLWWRIVKQMVKKLQAHKKVLDFWRFMMLK